jgi:hypothetical protein
MIRTTHIKTAKNQALSEETANAIYDILVETCGASEHDRSSFVYNQTTSYCREWRFQGKLGFGGKFYNERNEWVVSCYITDETPQINRMTTKANAQLETLRKKCIAQTKQAATEYSYEYHGNDVLLSRAANPHLMALLVGQKALQFTREMLNLEESNATNAEKDALIKKFIPKEK